jgi:hypothetical protein
MPALRQQRTFTTAPTGRARQSAWGMQNRPRRRLLVRKFVLGSEEQKPLMGVFDCRPIAANATLTRDLPQQSLNFCVMGVPKWP